GTPLPLQLVRNVAVQTTGKCQDKSHDVRANMVVVDLALIRHHHIALDELLIVIARWRCRGWGLDPAQFAGPLQQLWPNITIGSIRLHNGVQRCLSTVEHLHVAIRHHCANLLRPIRLRVWRHNNHFKAHDHFPFPLSHSLWYAFYTTALLHLPGCLGELGNLSPVLKIARLGLPLELVRDVLDDLRAFGRWDVSHGMSESLTACSSQHHGQFTEGDTGLLP